jgi:sialidase-1
LIASHYSIPSINLAKEVHDKINAGEFSWEYEFKDLHPSAFGQEIYFQTIKSFLEKSLDLADRAYDQMIGKSLPAPLNPHNFDHGRYLPINEAALGKGFQLVDHWHPSDNASTREGFVRIPVLEAVTPGAELSLSFKGKAIGMAVLAGPDAGIIEYSIDKKPFQKMDLYTQWSSGLHLPWYKLFAAGLPDRKHNLRLRVLSDTNAGSKGTACRIVHFLLDGQMY